MLSRDLGSVYLAPSFTPECCTAAEETKMLKLTLILAVLGVPIGLGTYEANDNDRCRERYPAHNFECSSYGNPHDGLHYCPATNPQHHF